MWDARTVIPPIAALLPPTQGPRRLLRTPKSVPEGQAQGGPRKTSPYLLRRHWARSGEELAEHSQQENVVPFLSMGT